ncbi:HNH endonuclease signature motif containing protein [Streptomyces sp. DSM 44915]|uniref:HNH endonuclease signature motif containing protein n=1 Tax=Streptomyces chisholmiae TaxID=3075540 RepID=A0ABU2K1H6_9ACTN|nr:HNH endonuclease signature motif containing protein [Streptomyces sp. DSM 44915]MDT0270861.1 HNH endonuclease signature motif containing protein [Streptomyces sp. DSM 44915]
MSAKKRKGYPRLTGDTRRQIRAYLVERDGARCFYCGHRFAEDLSDVTLDHFIPYRLWPVNKPRNLRLACEPCNNLKADALPWPVVWAVLSTFRPENFEPAA